MCGSGAQKLRSGCGQRHRAGAEGHRTDGPEESACRVREGQRASEEGRSGQQHQHSHLLPQLWVRGDSGSQAGRAEE